MNKLFLTMLFALSTTLASAQFVGLTTFKMSAKSAMLLLRIAVTGSTKVLTGESKICPAVL